MRELPNDRSDFARKQVPLRIIQKRLEVFLLPELPIEQAGFRRGRGTRRKHNERGLGRKGEENQHRRENLRYADDTTLLAGTKEYLIERVEKSGEPVRKPDYT